MADTLDNQDYFSGLAQDLLGKIGLGAPASPGMGVALIQALTNPPPGASPPVAGHLLGHVPTYAPPALGGSMPPVKTDIGGNADDVSQAIGQGFIEAQRPDLGLGGNLIRTLVPEGFSRDMFQNYWQGKGDNVELSQDRFKDIVDYANTLPQKPAIPVTGLNGESLQRRTYSFYGSPDYKRSLGSASLFYDQSGNPVGFYDNYNFDPSNSKRTLIPEIETRFMHVVGPWHGAKPFPIYYGEYAPPN